VWTRREILDAAAGFVGVGLASARCARTGADRGASPQLPPTTVSVPWEQVASGQRRIIVVDGNPVELLQEGGTVRARSLRCTHLGCVVRWKETEQVYLCPCHEGRYDADGQVIAGPPPAALRRLPVKRAGNFVLVGGK
jgi:cytochrome b6-f complex iron-sulfur subunit